jgi:hypothetical protein
VDAKDISHVKIHPAIGLARVGNSPDGFFVGPERPGLHPRPLGGYKDAQGRIKRQAARFRLFAYDAGNNVLGELRSADAQVAWTVHVANRKAAWHEFRGLDPNGPLRNKHVGDRESLMIDPGPRTLSGPGSSATFDGGKFLGQPVPLGEARVDERGRLLVLGGFGHSESVPKGRPIGHYANNDGWHDDVSDGPVTATVGLAGRSDEVPVSPAWVICPPPDFAPAITNVLTLYDTLFDAAVRRGWLQEPWPPSFTRDVYPLIERAVGLRWVSRMVAEAHSTLPPAFSMGFPAALKQAIFARLRDPATPGGQDSDGDMPMIWSDYYPAPGNQPLTRTQYRIMQNWANGHFVDDWNGPPRPSRTVTAAGLDRAALEACIGGAFFPGIEASWFVRDRYAFVEPFRLDHKDLQAGDVTKQMAVPWQADFNECAQEDEYAWWPAQRPDDVIPSGSDEMVPWTRDLVSSDLDMVKHWHRLGFLVRRGARIVEEERTAKNGGR